MFGGFGRVFEIGFGCGFPTIEMIVGMIANSVSGFLSGLKYFRMLHYILTDAKESGFGIKRI